MLDTLPKPLRNVLWALKHRALVRAHNAQLAEYFQGLLASVLRATAPQLAVDVGANTGQYARMLRRVGYGGRIVSFEPVPANVDLLLAAAATDRDWEIRGCAVDVQGGTAQLRCANASVYSSLLRVTSEAEQLIGPAAATAAVVDVQVSRLDEAHLPDAESIHLKVDTQGTDLAVVRSMGALLNKVSSLTIELGTVPLYEGQPTYIESLRELDSLGFRVAGVFPVSRDRAYRALDADFLFVRA